MKPKIDLERLEPRRLCAFGDYDTTFGNGGLISAGSAEGSATVLTDGRIALRTGAALRMYTSAGQLDTSFGGGDGIANLNVRAVYAAAGGKFFTLSSNPGVDQTGLIRRYKADGSLDTAYGTGGAATVPFDIGDRADASPTVLVAPDGSLYAFEHVPESDDTPAIVHITAAGQIDTGFGTNGLLNLPGSPAFESSAPYSVYSINNLKLGSDGSLLVAGRQVDVLPRYSEDGQFQISPKVRGASAFVARVTTAGKIDTTFGDKGFYRVSGGLTTLGGTVLALSQRRALLVYSVDGRLQTVEVNAKGGGRGVLRTTGIRDAQAQSIFGFGNPPTPLRLPDGRVVVTIGGSVTTLTRGRGVWQVGPMVGLTQLSAGGVVGSGIDASGRLIVSGYQAADYTTNTKYQIGRIDLTGEPSGYLAGEFGAGTENDVAVRKDGSVDLVYYDSKRKSLRYAHRTAAGRWGRPETLNASLPKGVQLDLNLNSRDVPYVAYYDVARGDLRLTTRFSNGKWGGNSDGSSNPDNTGLAPSLQFSTRDDPYIVFYNKTDGTLNLSYPFYTEGGGTTTETVDTLQPSSYATDLAIDPVRGTFAIAYAGPNNTVRLAERNRGGWTIRTVATTKAGVGDLSLGFDNLTTPGKASARTRQATTISYYDVDRADLVIARRPAPGKAFSSTRVATAGATGLYPQFQIGTYGQRTVFWDRTRDEVRSGYDLSRDPTTNNATLTGLENGRLLAADIPVTGGGRYLSVAAFSVERVSPSVFAYVETDSGELVVRDA